MEELEGRYQELGGQVRNQLDELDSKFGGRFIALESKQSGMDSRLTGVSKSVEEIQRQNAMMFDEIRSIAFRLNNRKKESELVGSSLENPLIPEKGGVDEEDPIRRAEREETRRERIGRDGY